MTLRPLSPCGSGSCVSTQAARTDPQRRIEPLPFALPSDVAVRAVLSVLGRFPRLRILERDLTSIHAVERSPVLRIPLDLEVRIDGAAQLIHLRVSTPVALRERTWSRTRAVDLLGRFDRALRSAA